MVYTLDYIIKLLSPYYELEYVKQINCIVSNQILNIYVGKKKFYEFYFIFTTDNNIVEFFRISNGHNCKERELDKIYSKNCSILIIEISQFNDVTPRDKLDQLLFNFIENSLDKYIPT